MPNKPENELSFSLMKLPIADEITEAFQVKMNMAPAP